MVIQKIAFNSMKRIKLYNYFTMMQLIQIIIYLKELTDYKYVLMFEKKHILIKNVNAVMDYEKFLDSFETIYIKSLINMIDIKYKI